MFQSTGDCSMAIKSCVEGRCFTESTVDCMQHSKAVYRAGTVFQTTADCSIVNMRVSMIGIPMGRD